uniref:Ribonuclease T2 n=1 Tax=Salvator merianae TaxID=96440 RepID=A0A8D0ECG8_SALMN
MKPMISFCMMAGSLSLAIFCGFATQILANSDLHHKWEMLYLVHQWPVTVCKMNVNDCKDPLMYWTIHGLWPDKAGECNRSWHFDISELKDIMGDMKQYWPDVLHPNGTHFWRHEWEKHGTCAATLEALNTQKKYFGKGLELYKNINLNSYLLKAEIKPGNTSYELAAIKEALTRFYSVTPKLQCLPPEEGQLQTLGQIKFCFTKEFMLRNCTEPKPDSISSSDHGHKYDKIEDLSICEDGLLYYPAYVEV